ncbi:hypothetical protein, partial [Sinorhizobium psoraleae]|uniref:hypothetical protein n=1 Tax=Sinorhizobium psoraleae TaxID=520838 RepID=UPI001AEEC72C
MKNFSCAASPRRADTGLPVTNSISEKLRLQRLTKSSCERLKLVTPLHNSERNVVPRQVKRQSPRQGSHNVLQLGQNPSFEPTEP